MNAGVEPTVKTPIVRLLHELRRQVIQAMRFLLFLPDRLTMQDVGIRSTLESYRLAKEGYTDRIGDVLVDPREISVGSLFLNSLGIPLTEINKIKSTRGQQYKLDQYFKEHSGQLRKAYVEANRDRNRAQQKDIRNA